MFFGLRKPATLPTPSEALPGRDASMPVAATHVVLGSPMRGPWPGMEEIVVAMGCFWGAERKFWQQDGVVCTAVGYAGGHTPNPTYEEVCSGKTAHTEVVRVIFDPTKVTLAALLKVFWENHDPTQGMRQGNDTGTQYRSALYVGAAQLAEVQANAAAYGAKLKAAGFGAITTEIRLAPTFYYAEDYHQQYLSAGKNPNGYCGLSGTGVSCPIGVLEEG